VWLRKFCNFHNFSIKVCINLSSRPQITTESAEALKPQKKLRRITMFRKIVSVLAIAPLALNFVATAPAQAQIQAAACRQLIFEGANFRTVHIYPQDPNVYSAPLRITHVHGSSWSGVLNIHNSEENVEGTISRTEFTMRRPSGQTWSATCTPGGISGNLKKQGVRGVGAFVLTPSVARR
jgi:hypothetical protein